jgi:hypothetical protein
MTSRVRRQLAGTTTVAACALVLAGAAPASAQSGCKAEHLINAQSYTSRICDVPDYDQRRKPGTISGDGRTFGLAGLKADGGCHCVPTAVTNMLGYYVQKGVDIPPPPAAARRARPTWTDRACRRAPQGGTRAPPCRSSRGLRESPGMPGASTCGPPRLTGGD